MALWWALRDGGVGRTARRTRSCVRDQGAVGQGRAASAGELADGGEGFEAELYQGAGKIR